MSEIELINHYPWLPSLKEFYADIASKPPADFIREIFTGDFSNEIYNRILILFKAAFQNLEEIPEYKVDRVNVYLYLLLKILLYVLDNKIISNRIANLYSKINYKEIFEENDYNLYYICEALELDVLYNDKPWIYGKTIVKDQSGKLETNFKIHYTDYLRLAANLRDEYRKLINNPLSRGYVFIQRKALVRLLQEYVRLKLLPSQTDDKSTKEAFKTEMFKIESFEDLHNKISNEWAKREEEFEYTFEFDFSKTKDLSQIFPPCVKEILKKAKEGQNLIHNERLFIVWFLIALEYPVDNIVDLFSTMPDFNREKTRYQVEFAKKKKYTPYKCSTLKSYKLCLAGPYKDELCLKGYYSKKQDKEKQLSHPLGYVRVSQYRVSKKEYNEKKRSGDKNE